MRTRELVLLIALAIFCLSLTPISFREVLYVYDGDTILLKGKDRVRYLGIDAPEMDHEGGKSEFMANAARNYNFKLVGRACVRLEFDQERRDRHGRLLAYVFKENGDMVNALLVKKGLAHVMFNKKNTRYRDLFLDSQRKAMKAKLGIWSAPFKKQERSYIGNRNSYRFHGPKCPFGVEISRKNRIRFKSRYHAFWEGFSPCRKCKP